MTLHTEKVATHRELSPGAYAVDTYWIAYPTWVAAYANVEDRTLRAYGVGYTRQEALDVANIEWPLAEDVTLP